MPLLHALALIAAVAAVAVVIERRWLHPFLALVAGACAFAAATGFSLAFLGKAFGNGFAQAAYAPGLVIVAAAFVAAIAASTGAYGWVTTKLSPRVAATLSLIAGLSASPSSAFAVLAPLLRAIGGGHATTRTIVAPALALSAGHGLLLSPVMIASAAIIGAGWTRVALIGVPVAIVAALVGVAWARLLPAPPTVVQPSAASPLVRDERGGWPAAVFLAATLIPLLMLMATSIGDIPSEPLGGASNREFIIGLGRPLILMLVALGIMAAGLWGISRVFLADASWTGSVIGNAAPLVLTIAAAIGLQKLCQETGMAELLGEKLLDWRAGLLVPFAIAAVIKTLQGSSLVAAITAAGMIQPLLASLGLDQESGKALAALSVGAGAMTASHANDDYFWLVSGSAGIGPARALVAISLGTAVQGVAAVAVLILLGTIL